MIKRGTAADQPITSPPNLVQTFVRHPIPSPEVNPLSVFHVYPAIVQVVNYLVWSTTQSSIFWLWYQGQSQAKSLAWVGFWPGLTLSQAKAKPKSRGFAGPARSSGECPHFALEMKTIQRKSSSWLKNPELLGAFPAGVGVGRRRVKSGRVCKEMCKIRDAIATGPVKSTVQI
ncbi:hypothetical protein B0H17DRAFT_1135850 [Mycena rosella]|uniref:Uncharacterized protein n=1 Tax=Mycena rosella TaxID=1033263 RepID=A0AAD7DC41_MYCRO|nr:hypothetical protein B0H17DRAFT_1135850 [Mycena rosella]